MWRGPSLSCGLWPPHLKVGIWAQGCRGGQWASGLDSVSNCVNVFEGGGHRDPWGTRDQAWSNAPPFHDSWAHTRLPVLFSQPPSLSPPHFPAPASSTGLS